MTDLHAALERAHQKLTMTKPARNAALVNGLTSREISEAIADVDSARYAVLELERAIRGHNGAALALSSGGLTIV